MNSNLINQQTFECYICSKKYSNNGTFDQHLKSKKHMANYLKSSKVTDQESVDDNLSVNSFDLTSAEDEDLQCGNFCMFCNTGFESMEKCLLHMKGKHSFMILHSEYLSDLTGLLNQLGTDILKYGHCYYCEKSFDTIKKCQQHMTSKSHCQMNDNWFKQIMKFQKYSQFYKTDEIKKIYGNSQAINLQRAQKRAQALKIEVEDVKKKDKKVEDCSNSSASFEIISSGGFNSENSFQIVDISDYESSDGFTIVDYKQSDHTSAISFDIDCTSEVESEAISVPHFQGYKKLRNQKKPTDTKTKEQKKQERKDQEQNYKAQKEAQKYMIKVSLGNNKINQTNLKNDIRFNLC